DDRRGHCRFLDRHCHQERGAGARGGHRRRGRDGGAVRRAGAGAARPPGGGRPGAHPVLVGSLRAVGAGPQRAVFAGPSARLFVPGLTDIPFLGKLLFGQDGLVYVSLAMVVAVAWVLERTRLGLIVRAIGENHDAAHAIGYPVVAYRYLALLFGGAMAGLGGAYLSLVQT